MALNEYKIQNDQSIFDIVNLTIGDLDSTYQLLIDNPYIPKISTIPIGVTIVYTPKKITPNDIKVQNLQEAVKSENYYSRQNQTVYDVCLQTIGDLNKIYQLIQDSNFSNLQTSPFAGTLFKFNPQEIKDNLFKKYLKSNGIVINTGNIGSGLSLVVYGDEDFNFIYTNEDGTQIYTPES